MDEDAFEKKFNTLEVDFIRSQQLFCREVLKLSPGQRAVISNGRVSAQLNSSFTSEYWTIDFCMQSWIDHIRKVKYWLNVAFIG